MYRGQNVPLNVKAADVVTSTGLLPFSVMPPLQVLILGITSLRVAWTAGVTFLMQFQPGSRHKLHHTIA